MKLEKAVKKTVWQGQDHFAYREQRQFNDIQKKQIERMYIKVLIAFPAVLGSWDSYSFSNIYFFRLAKFPAI